MSGPEQPNAAKREAGRIARAVGVLSSATLLSRVLGLVRDMVTAAFFGAGGPLDAFFVAFRLPNMLRSLLAEGSLTVAFIPVYVEHLEKEGEQAAHRLGRVAFTLLGTVLVGVVLLGIAFAPWLVRLVAMGFSRDPEKLALTVDLARMVFPYIGFVGFTALAGGMLNARNRFLYPALAPVVLNVCIIGAVMGLSSFVVPPITSLAYGVLAGGLCQLLLQLKPLGQTGFRFRPEYDWKHPAVRRILLLMGPSVLGVAVYQVNLLVSTFLASWLPDGSISYLYYAERLFQLPLGVFAVAVGVASLPSFSRLAARQEWEAFQATVSGSIRLLWFVVLPASVGLLLLSEPIVALLFQRGKFDAAMTLGTAHALSFYALALIPVATTRVIAQGFYAMKDTKTPVKAACWSLAVNLVASLLLMGPMLHVGLALATAISAACNTVYLAWRYRQRTGNWPFAGMGSAFGKMGIAAGVMASLLIGFYLGFDDAATQNAYSRALFVLVSVTSGAAVYFLTARLAGLHDLSQIVARLRNR